jgi:hypothetical protein
VYYVTRLQETINCFTLRVSLRQSGQAVPEQVVGGRGRAELGGGGEGADVPAAPAQETEEQVVRALLLLLPANLRPGKRSGKAGRKIVVGLESCRETKLITPLSVHTHM